VVSILLFLFGRFGLLFIGELLGDSGSSHLETHLLSVVSLGFLLLLWFLGSSVLLLWLLLGQRIFSDVLVGGLVHCLDLVWCDSRFDVASKVLL